MTAADRSDASPADGVEATPRPAAPGRGRGSRGPYAKSAERRAAIVDAAFDVFSSRGYRGGSLQEVADRVGVSQTSLLHYFPSKRDLLRAVLERRDAVSTRGDGSGGAGPGSAADGDEDFTEAVLRQARHNEAVPGLIGLYTALAGEATTDDSPVRDYVASRFDDLRSEYAEGFRALREQGRLVDGVDPDRAAAALVALWDGIQLQWLIDPTSVDVVAQLREHIDRIVLPA